MNLKERITELKKKSLRCLVGLHDFFDPETEAAIGPGTVAWLVTDKPLEKGSRYCIRCGKQKTKTPRTGVFFNDDYPFM